MDEKQKLVFGTAAIIGGSIIVAAFIAAPPRYALATGSGAAFRLDRSTGTMLLCGQECRPIPIYAETFQDAQNAAAAAANAAAPSGFETPDMTMDTNMTMDANAADVP
jgi:hypothetical protein